MACFIFKFILTSAWFTFSGFRCVSTRLKFLLDNPPTLNFNYGNLDFSAYASIQ